ncbi:NRDE family protein [Luteimonas viscosa]|uniref:NRDE family protein n=1 Tax=Luteimonas viscosa TaxID=1132694 RepID=A0A5D4XLR3_9GAMM|nr:NRDE family protein [Luteimonas viscosa]TYT25084.1 NRDE family protein [Luteimonas viscosa]
MCLVAVAWRAHPRWPLVLVANRDEFHARPAAPAAFDPDSPSVYGGRDLVQGGSWLQVARNGRLAAVTNVRDGIAAEAAPRSRGWLVRDFVRSETPAGDFAAALAGTADQYGRYNLLLHDGDRLLCAGNHPAHAMQVVAPGLHAMSNGAFDAPWPKSTFATRALEGWIGSPLAEEPDMAALEPLYGALRDTTRAPDADLPDTGVGLELERALSPPFVLDPRYGTRCSSVVLVGDGRVIFGERRFGPDGAAIATSLETITLDTAGA